jgi:glutamate synthase domain-containing protein 1
MSNVNGRTFIKKRSLEGGCGVIGLIGSEKLKGNCIIRPCEQMRNRGNGKGGGVAAVGLFDEYKDFYALHISFLDEKARGPVEKKFINSVFQVSHAEKQKCMDDYRETGLEVKPPVVWRYFVRVKPEQLEHFAEKNKIIEISAAEDEFVFQNSFRLNAEFYENRQDPRAFVLSHGRDLMILKGVGYAEEIARYYRLEETLAHLWIGHQRYPTRGRVWHPGGAHPFAGLHEALVHNGDFANYHAVCEYLRQWGLVPQFTTDTEVSVLLFDLYSRVLGYPIEFVIEALAPTPEGDFERLSKRRQRIYRAIQSAHLHGSPDGPWFFIVARADPESGVPQLIGITDVSMLRPQVFCLYEGKKSFGAIASEKQALDAFFEEVASEDSDVPSRADRYWAARGGSCTDGGAFVYTLKKENGKAILDVRDKFGNQINGISSPRAGKEKPSSTLRLECGTNNKGNKKNQEKVEGNLFEGTLEELKKDLQQNLYEGFKKRTKKLVEQDGIKETLGKLTLLLDRRWNPVEGRRTFQIAALERSIQVILDSVPAPEENTQAEMARLDWSNAWESPLPKPDKSSDTLVIDAGKLPNDGPEATSRVIASAHAKGWRKFIIYRCRGDRFIGCGLGPNTNDVRIDVYGSSGGPGRTDPQVRENRNLRERGSDVFVWSERRGSLCHGICSRSPLDQCCGPYPDNHQRHLPRLLCRKFYGR